MSFLEIKQSGPDVPDGAYPMILSSIDGDPEQPNQPRHVVPEQGPNAGKDLYFWDWRFRINFPGEHPLNGTEFKYGTSTATGPRSKMFGLLTALLNGQRPAVGMKFEQSDLIGRQVFATVQRDEQGYCDIVSFSPVPAHLQQQAFAAQTGAPTQGTPVTAQQAVAPAPVAGQAPAAAAPAAPVSVAPAAPEGQFQVQQIVPPMPAAAPRPADDLPF